MGYSYEIGTYLFFAVDGAFVLSTKPLPEIPTKIVEDYPLFTIPLLFTTTASKVSLVTSAPTEVVEGRPFAKPFVIIVKDSNNNPLPRKLVFCIKSGIT